MASISGKVFLFSGLFIGVFSILMNYRANSKAIFIGKFTLFAVLGTGFFIYGLVKTLFLENNKQIKKPQQNQIQQRPAHAMHQSAAQYPQNANQRMHKFCQRCGKQLHIHDNFCSYCGNRV